MKNLILPLAFLLTIISCAKEEQSIIGTWKGKNYAGQDIQWVFNADGTASSARGAASQQMTYKIDKTKTPYHLNVNSLVDTNTLRAIYQFTDNGKLMIGIGKELVTVRPTGFSGPNLQKLVLTKD